MTDPARRLVVLRHGQTGHNAAGIWQGRLDTDLSDLGREQARRAGAALAALAPALLVSSDLRRAADTADAVAAATGLPVRRDPRLQELHVGRWQGLAQADVAHRYPREIEALHAGEDPARGVDGERFSDVVARARPAVDDVLASLEPGALGVVVTHGVTARAIVADLAGLDPALGWRVLGGLGNACWAVLEEDRRVGAWRIARWNVSADFGLPVTAG